MANNFDMLFNNTSDQTSEVVDVVAITQTSDAPVKIPGGAEIINKIIWAKDSTEILKLFCDLLTYQSCTGGGSITTYPSTERSKDRRKNFDLISSLIYDELIIKKGLYQITLKHFNDLVININYTYYFGKGITILKNSQTALDKIQRALDDLEIKLKCESGDSIISIDRIVSTDLNGNVVKYQPGNIQIIPWVLNNIKKDLNLDNQIDYKKYEVRVRNKFLGKPFMCEACEKPIVDSTPHRENMCRGCVNAEKVKWRKDNKEYLKEYNKNNKEKNKEYLKEYNKNNKEKIKETTRKYYEDNKEKIKEYLKEYNKNNKEKNKEYLKEYNKDNKEKIKEYRKEYNKNNKEKIKETTRKYYEDNKEKIKETTRKYYEDNKDKINAKRRQRNKLKKSQKQ